MNTLAVLLLAGATAAGGIFGKPHVSGKRFLRSGVVMEGPAPPGGPINMNAGQGQGMNGASAALRGRRFPNTRSQVYFVEPIGMKIGWQAGGGATGEKVFLPAQLSAPARYNFNQGFIYRLKLTDIPDQPTLVLYPTIEVAPSTPATDAYLTHNAIPIVFEEQDFEQIKAGNFITKVIYLPDPKFQELAVAGVETLVSTRLEPGIDPILEADRRGTILLIIRVGAIDLEMPTLGANAPGAATTAPAANAENGDVTLPPGSLPPGAVPTAPASTPGVPVDNDAPVSPAPPSPSTPPTAPEAAPPADEAKPEPAAEAPKAEVPAPAPAPAPAGEAKPEPPAAEEPK